MKIEPKKIVCVFAHPDDESFGPGGSIAYFSEKCDVSVICVTSGDAEEKFAKGNDVNALSKIRQNELRSSAKILGVKDVYLLNFKDGSLCNNNYHEVADDVQKILKKIKPDTLMTFDLNGVSGHLDHIAIAMETTYLFERLPFVKNLMYFCEKKEIKKIVGKNYFVYFPEGYEEKEMDFIIDVRKFLDKKIRAMRAHVSQKSDCDWILKYFKKHLNKEYFRVLTK